MSSSNPFTPSTATAPGARLPSAAYLSRRAFLARLAALSATLGLFPMDAGSQNASVAKSTSAPESTDERLWRTLSLVQDHLLPSAPESPGARDVNATAYLRTVLSQPRIDPEDKTFLLRGVTWLEDYSLEHEGKDFASLDTQAREGILRQIEGSRAGENWLSLLLLFSLEAMLADPAYGCNPDGIGWKWLQHQPGFPTPPRGKRYFEL